MTFKEVLRIRDFRNLWLGQAISQMGDSFYNIVFLFMVMKLTGNVALTGFVAAMEWLPYLLLGPYAGVIADRMDRRMILLWSDIFSAAVLGVFGAVVLFSGRAPLVALFITPFLLSSFRVFFMPAKGASIPRLVPVESLNVANALSMTTQSMMPVISIPLSVTIMTFLYEFSPIIFWVSAVGLNLLSFAISAWFVAKLPKIIPDQTEEKHPFEDIKDGFHYIRNHSVLLVMVFVSFFLNLFISPFYIVYLATNNQWFDGRPQTIAYFEWSFFVGMAIGSVVCGKIRTRYPGQANSWSLAIVGVTVLVMAFSRNIWAFCWWNMAAGIALPWAHIPMQTYIQSTTEDSFRGRVNSALSMVSAGVHPVGMFMAGIMVAGIGLVGSYVVMGAGMAIVAMLALLHAGYRKAETVVAASELPTSKPA